MSAATDSPRWCETCHAYGDHHTDRHPTASVPVVDVEALTRLAADVLSLPEWRWGRTFNGPPMPPSVFIPAADLAALLDRLKAAEAVAKAVDEAVELGNIMMIDGWSAESARTAITHLRRVAVSARGEQL